MRETEALERENDRGTAAPRRGGKRLCKQGMSGRRCRVLGGILLTVALLCLACWVKDQNRTPSGSESAACTWLDPTCLQTDGSYYMYRDPARGIGSRTGIDVSSHQGEIDWRKVKRSGVSFAMIRLGFRGYGSGELKADDWFAENLRGAQAAGIDCGVYVYSQAVSIREAREEARFALEQLDGAELELPVVYDLETAPADDARTTGLGGAQATDQAVVFCQEMETSGYPAMIYMNGHWAGEMYDLQRLQEHLIWYAGYDVPPDFPAAVTMWQYSDRGSVDGVEGPVDLDLLFTALPGERGKEP